MQILIPMAGSGQRFRDAGYTLPKPMLEVDGVPMIVRVVEDLPAASHIVFVVNGEHVRDFQIDQQLREYFPSARIVTAPGLTQGQACSVRLGIDTLDPADSVLVAACDNTHVFDSKAFGRMASDPANDAIIWTYRGEPRVLVNPNWYGWVSADADGRVQRVSVKRPISDAPLNDHVVTGTFWFRSADLLKNSIDLLVKSNIRINNEFYLDSVPSLLIEQGRGVKVFEIEKYIGWGTPADYVDYHRWSEYVQRRIVHSAA